MTGLNTSWLPAANEPRGILVALPGLMESVEAMLPTLRHWAARGFDVLGIDPRGHATSPRWSDTLLARHPGDVIVDDIVDTLDQTPLDAERPLILFGHSAGGAAAAAVATRLAGRVRAVILEDPFWRLPVTQFQDERAAEKAAAELRRVRELAPACRIAEIQTVFPQWPADELTAWAQAKHDADIAIVANGDVIPSRGWTSCVSELVGAGIPLLVITGSIGTGMTTNHRAILRALGAEVIVVRGATHFIRRDARDLFHDLTDTFLDRHLPPSVETGAVRPTAASGNNDKSLASHVTPRDLLPLGGPSWPK